MPYSQTDQDSMLNFFSQFLDNELPNETPISDFCVANLIQLDEFVVYRNISERRVKRWLDQNNIPIVYIGSGPARTRWLSTSLVYNAMQEMLRSAQLKKVKPNNRLPDADRKSLSHATRARTWNLIRGNNFKKYTQKHNLGLLSKRYRLLGYVYHLHLYKMALTADTSLENMYNLTRLLQNKPFYATFIPKAYDLAIQCLKEDIPAKELTSTNDFIDYLFKLQELDTNETFFTREETQQLYNEHSISLTSNPNTNNE